MHILSSAAPVITALVGIFTFVFTIALPASFRDPVWWTKRRVEALKALKKSMCEDRNCAQKIDLEIGAGEAKEYAYMQHKGTICFTAYFECIICAMQAWLLFLLLSYRYCYFTDSKGYCEGINNNEPWDIIWPLGAGTLIASLGIIAIAYYWHNWVKEASYFINDKQEGLERIVQTGFLMWFSFFALNIVCIILVVWLREADASWNYAFYSFTGIEFILSLSLPLIIVYRAASKHVERLVLEQEENPRKSDLLEM